MKQKAKFKERSGSINRQVSLWAKTLFSYSMKAAQWTFLYERGSVLVCAGNRCATTRLNIWAHSYVVRQMNQGSKANILNTCDWVPLEQDNVVNMYKCDVLEYTKLGNIMRNTLILMHFCLIPPPKWTPKLKEVGSLQKLNLVKLLIICHLIKCLQQLRTTVYPKRWMGVFLASVK